MWALLLLGCTTVEPISTVPFPTMGKLFGPDGAEGYGYGDNLVIFDANTSGADTPRVWVMEGAAEGTEDFVATKVGVARLEVPTLGTPTWTLDHTCEGGLEKRGGTVTFALSGSPVCDRFQGTFKTELQRDRDLRAAGKTPPVKPRDRSACGRYIDCVCGTSYLWDKGGNNPFTQLCTDSKRIRQNTTDDPKECEAAREVVLELASGMDTIVAPACSDTGPYVPAP